MDDLPIIELLWTAAVHKSYMMDRSSILLEMDDLSRLQQFTKYVLLFLYLRYTKKILLLVCFWVSGGTTHFYIVSKSFELHFSINRMCLIQNVALMPKPLLLLLLQWVLSAEANIDNYQVQRFSWYLSVYVSVCTYLQLLKWVNIMFCGSLRRVPDLPAKRHGAAIWTDWFPHPSLTINLFCPVVSFVWKKQMMQKHHWDQILVILLQEG